MRKREVVWSFGVTTVPSRFETTLIPTIESLSGGKFENPWLFVDGPSSDLDSGLYRTARSLGCHFGHPNRSGTAGNWMLACLELYVRDPKAQYIAIFQDDLLCVRNLRPYLEATLPKLGEDKYFNLYTFPPERNMQAPPPSRNYLGWYESNQCGRGAVGLVFPRCTIPLLFSAGNGRLLDRMNDSHRGHRNIDGGIIESMKLAGIKEMVHAPSLLQHTGDVSSFGNRPHPKTRTWPGPDFDALDWLREKTE